MQQQPIAILDSGVGGLTVVKEVMRQLPREKIIYFGDTARTPYGPRPAEEVIGFTEEIVSYLIQYNPKMIVIACNTATAVALDTIRAQVNIPVVGVIQPGARAAVKQSLSGIIGVIGTEGTIKSGAYELELKKMAPYAQVISEPCPEFVPLVERGEFCTLETLDIVRKRLAMLSNKRGMDTLILGCTHYPFLADAISQVMGSQVTLINSAYETAREITAILYKQKLLDRGGEGMVHQFFCSGNAPMFKPIALQWLGRQGKRAPIAWHLPHN
ncbi:glutamate racemase [Paenibacillus sp. GCM10027626]|uniref:glutamate racemase n=1 Tax=Paenibacillus sp. GCM10027626 TaxID=3273411 RepID=UPI00363D3C0D